MPGDNIEVMDDFIVDMDIETITLDSLDHKESADMLESVDDELSMDTAAGDNLMNEVNLGGNIIIENIELTDPTIQSQGPIRLTSESKAMSDAPNFPASAPSPSFSGPSAAPQYASAPTGANTSSQNISSPGQNQAFQPPVQQAAQPQYVQQQPTIIREERVIIQQQGAMQTPAAYSNMEMPTYPDIPDFESTAAVSSGSSTPGSSRNKSAEPENALPEEFSIPDFEPMSTAEPSMPDFSAPPEIDLASPEAEALSPRFSEPVISDEPEPASQAVCEPSKTPEPEINTTDDIISIDGNDLDRIIYGEEAQKAAPVMAAAEPQPDESLDFTFDLSVIPDVAEIEEDEPIALSLDELNNIDISEDNVIEFNTPDSMAAIEPTTQVLSEEIAESPTEQEIPLSESSLKTMAGMQRRTQDKDIEIPMSDFIENTSQAPAAMLEESDNVEIALDDINEVSETLQMETSSPEVYGIEEPVAKRAMAAAPAGIPQSKPGVTEKIDTLSPETKDELRSVLSYLDNLLEDLPEEKIKEFAKSEYYDLYTRILDKLGI